MMKLTYDERLNLRLTRDERDRLAEIARHQERTLSQQVRLAVRWFLATQDVVTRSGTSMGEVQK